MEIFARGLQISNLNEICHLVQALRQATNRELKTIFLVFPLPLKLRVVHMRKKLKTLIFSKMAITILIKFSGFIVHSKPNNMTLSAFLEKSLKLEKQFNFLSVASPNVAPKPTGQSRSNSISRVPLQISLSRFFVFDLLSKLRVVHIRKIKISIFSKMAPTILIKFSGFIVCSKPNNMTLSVFP